MSRSEDAESPFLLEGLEPSQEGEMPSGLVRRLAGVSRELVPSARRHVERALVRQLLDSGVRERAALVSAVASLRRAVGGAASEAEDVYEASDGEEPAAEAEDQEDHECGESEETYEADEAEDAYEADESAGAEEADESEEAYDSYEADEGEDESTDETQDEGEEDEESEEHGESEEHEEYEESEDSEEYGEAEDEDESPFLASESYEDPGLLEAEDALAVLSPSELKAVRITSTFETGRAGGFGGLTGNFDGQGLSFGLMNWTIKAGSLIPLLKEFIRKYADRYTRIFGRDAERFRDMVFATRLDPKSRRQVRDVAAQMDFVRGQMNDAAQRHVVEPWKTYFAGLEHDPEFRRIEVEAARQGLAHARRWFDRFSFKTERGFVFMFDLVSSHGPWWLDAKKFHGKRKKLLAERLARRKAELGRELTELETMEVIARFIAAVSLPRWQKDARVRKLWFVRGKGKVHGSHYDISRDFGVSDGAPDFGSGPASPPVSHEIPPSPPGSTGDRFRQLVESGHEATAIAEAARSGQTDVAQLTNRVFFARHPELGGRKIREDERALRREWVEIRDTLVRPTLAGPGAAPGAPAPVPPLAGPGGVSGVPAYLGLDTASVGGNKNPDWIKARDQGSIRFAIIRSNWGVTRDRVFGRDWPKIKDAGLVRGAYLFLRFPHPKYAKPPAPPAAQAEAFIKTAGTLEHADFPPSLDVEFPGGRAKTGMTAAQITKGVREAWTVLKDHYGVAPILYTSARVWREDLGNAPAPDLVESPLWLTPYPFKPGPAVFDLARIAERRRDPKVPTPWGDATNWWIHQYQGDAVRLPGFPTGNIDMNFFNTTAVGATGDRVKWIQRRLGIPETGTFDAAMEAALRGFQSKRGLQPTGIVDPQTFAFLCWSNP